MIVKVDGKELTVIQCWELLGIKESSNNDVDRRPKDADIFDEYGNYKMPSNFMKNCKNTTSGGAHFPYLSLTEVDK